MITARDIRSDRPGTRIPTDPPEDKIRPGVALCLSGGGFRAMIFHLGALWRLNQLGCLKDLERVSSVSGGSIVAALMGLQWRSLAFNGVGVATNFCKAVVDPIRRFAEHTTDIGAILKGLLWPGSISKRVADAYRKHLFGEHTLQDLPDKPRFVINSTSVQSGVLFRFSKPYLWDYRVGKIEKPTIPIATAVAASSAFPPFLSPLILKFHPSQFVSGTGLGLQEPPYTRRVVLSDGGVYDNLGLEPAKDFETILVSDGGGQVQPEGQPKRNWIFHSIRVASLVDNQVRCLRKRQLIDSFIKKTRKGTYWGIRTHIKHYGLPDAIRLSPEHVLELAEIPTRLKKLPPEVQENLINWGYAVCDAAMRKHVLAGVPAPSRLPYPR